MTIAYAICAWLRSGKRPEPTQGRGVAGIRVVANGRAYIRVDGVLLHLGLFTTEAAARAAYLKAKARYHPSTPADLLQVA